MNSTLRRSRRIFAKWLCYTVLLFLCAAVQTMPGLLTVGSVKPLFILPLCLAVSAFESEADSAFFGAVGGLLWDFTSARTVGLFAIALLLSCFLVSLLVRLYFHMNAINFITTVLVVTLLICSMDFLFNYAMQNYADAHLQFVGVVLPTAIFTAILSPVEFFILRFAAGKFVIED